MIAIVLGYHSNACSDPFAVYVGNDAQEANHQLENPPQGTVRTELVVHPTVSRRRSFVVQPAEVPPAEDPAPAGKKK